MNKQQPRVTASDGDDGSGSGSGLMMQMADGNYNVDDDVSRRLDE